MSNRITRSKTKHLEAEKKQSERDLEAEKKQSEIKKEKEFEKRINHITEEILNNLKQINIIKKYQKKIKTKHAKRNDAAIRIQTQRRYKKNKPKFLKDYIKKIQPLYNKLQDLPLPILNKIVNKIFEKNYDDDVIKNIVTPIITSNTCNEFDMLLDNLFKVNKKILQYYEKSLPIIKRLTHESNIFANASNYGTSDEEVEINSEIEFNTFNIMTQKEMIFNHLSRLLYFRDSILKEFKIIVNILKKDNTIDSENIKLLENFIVNIDINWSDKIQITTGNTLEVKYVLPETITQIKEIFYDILNNKLIRTTDNLKQGNIITLINNALINWKSEYKKYSEYIKQYSKNIKTRRVSEVPPQSYYQNY